MWLLVVSTCVADASGAACVSDLSRAAFLSFQDCEDAAVVTHDRIRSQADQSEVTILALETRCLIVGATLAEERGAE